MSITSSLTIPSTLVTISSFSKSMSLFLFCKYVLLYPFFLDSAYRGYFSFSGLLPGVIFIVLWIGFSP